MKVSVIYIPPTFLDLVFGLTYSAEAAGENAFGRTERQALRKLFRKIAQKIPVHCGDWEVEL